MWSMKEIIRNLPKKQKYLILSDKVDKKIKKRSKKEFFDDLFIYYNLNNSNCNNCRVSILKYVQEN